MKKPTAVKVWLETELQFATGECQRDIDPLDIVVRNEAEAICLKHDLHRCGMIPHLFSRSPAKPFLVSAEIRDGEHEHYGYALLRANDQKSADRKAEKLFKQKHGLDTDGAYFGYNDGLTASRLRGVTEISEIEAATLVHLNLVHYA